MIDHGFHPVGNLHLEVSALGDREDPALIMFHGVLRDGRDFAPLWPALLPRWRLLCVSHRGHGQSSRASRYLVSDYVDDAIRFVNRLEGPVVLYGHSLGAVVSAAVAASMPERVEAVIMEDPPAASFVRNVAATAWSRIWEQMRPLARRAAIAEITRQFAEVRVPTSAGEVRMGDLRDPSSLRFSARCLTLLDPTVFDPLLEGRWLDGLDPDAMYSAVKCPALILRGDEALGGMLSPDEAHRIAGLMAEGYVTDVAGAGHLIHWQETEATTRLVLGFLESL